MEAWGSQTLGFHPGMQHSAQFYPRHPLWPWAVPLHAFLPHFPSINVAIYMIVFFSTAWTANLLERHSTSQDTVPLPTCVPVLYAMNGKHLTVSASSVIQQFKKIPTAKPTASQERYGATQRSGSFWFTLTNTITRLSHLLLNTIGGWARTYGRVLGK